MGNFATGHATNTEELFVGFNTKKLKVSSKDCDKIIGDKHKSKLAQKIWKASIDLIFQDIINNSDTFRLPTTSKEAEIFIKGYNGDKFVEARQNGKWQDIDYLASNFTGYQPVFRFQRAGYIIEKPIYLDKNRNKQITTRVNSGKTYY